MKLLVVQAAVLRVGAVTHTHAAQAASACTPGSRSCASPYTHDRDQSETWRVRFILRVAPEPRLETRAVEGPRIRCLGPPLLVRETFTARAQHALVVRMAALRAARFNPCAIREQAKAEKLARRFEALRRAMADPKPHVRRLKRKLAALAHRACDGAMRVALRRPPPSRIYDRAVDRRAAYESGAIVAELTAPPNSG